MNYLDIILNEKESYSLADMLRDDYECNAYPLIEFLNNFGILYPACDAEQLNSIAHNLILTQQGKITIYHILKDQGILPVIERPEQDESPDYDIGGFWS